MKPEHTQLELDAIKQRWRAALKFNEPAPGRACEQSRGDAISYRVGPSARLSWNARRNSKSFPFIVIEVRRIAIEPHQNRHEKNRGEHQQNAQHQTSSVEQKTAGDACARLPAMRFRARG